MTSFFALDGDKTLMISVSPNEMFWTFNPRTHTWQYDMASVSISPPSANISLDPLSYPPTPLRQDTRPRLDTDGIVSCFEEQFGDFLHLIASFGQTRHVKDLSDFARHGYLTFGAVVDRNKPEILAYFPSTPPPEWLCETLSGDVQATYSTSDPLRRRTAYLSQSVPFAEDCWGSLNDLVLIDDVQFSLVGTFYCNPASSATPVYLFVPPIPVEVVNNVYCIRYPLPDTLFFWCSDPAGQDVIGEEDWDTYGIPQLEIFTWIGSSWFRIDFATVQDHLRKRSCALNGRQYAWEHGCPELAYGDPHNPRIRVFEEPDTPEDINSFSQWPEHQGQCFLPLLRRTSPNCTHGRAVGDPNDNDSVSLAQLNSEAPKTPCIEANQTQTCIATSLSTEDDQEGPKIRIIHDLAPSHHYSQSKNNEYQPPAWPQAIYELFVLVWSFGVVILSVGVDRVTQVVGWTSPENMGIRSIAETGKETMDDRQTD
ncbi:hypothetical protein PM082_022833 [Marasmius tenuissimus]|nr:hypothetical protein PM082_022833 [Marasmius tenuissimus]